ncbi:hypothetical protein [Streptomyces sp. YIM S03343]
MTKAGRGRPPSPAREQPGTTPVARRTAWLLRVNRYYGTAEEWTRGSTFAKAFQGGAWPHPVDPSRISRWENAQSPLPYQAVRRYEELLELPPRLLTSAIDTVNRYATPACGASPLLPRPTPDEDPSTTARTADLLDAVTGRTTVTAADWDDLTAALAARPDVWLRAGDWSALCTRLLTETLISDGAAWKQRFEAMSRLLRHPTADRYAVSACAEAAVPGNQGLVETVCLLDTSAHPEAARQVLTQLHDPVNDDAFYGALLACVRKIPDGHFTAVQLAEVASICTELLHDTNVRYDDARALAAVLIATIPKPNLPPTTHRTAAAHTHHPDGTTCGATQPPPDEALLTRITQTTLAALPREMPRFDDDILRKLVRETLYARVSDVRMHAALLLAATPYRTPLARALKTRITRQSPPHPHLLLRLLSALRNLNADAERPWAEHLVLHPNTSPPIANAAAQALAHLGGRSDDTFWTSALTRYTPRSPVTTPSTERILSTLIYALGMKGDTTHLTTLSTTPALPPTLRAQARWWTTLPHSVRFGAPDRPPSQAQGTNAG